MLFRIRVLLGRSSLGGNVQIFGEPFGGGGIQVLHWKGFSGNHFKKLYVAAGEFDNEFFRCFGKYGIVIGIAMLTKPKSDKFFIYILRFQTLGDAFGVRIG